MATNFVNPGTFTIGPNNSIAILDQNGNEISFGKTTQINFTARPVTQRTPVNLMQGLKEDLVFDQGWMGDVTIQRTNADLDVFWSALEAQVRAGIVRPIFTIMQRIQETDGTISTVTFFDCQITYDEAGTFANEEGVVQKLTFTAIARDFQNQ